MIPEAFRLLVRDLRQRTIKIAPKYLFHFTNVDAFMGICCNNEIWLGDVRFMNDPTELAFGENVARDALRHLGNDTGASIVRKIIEDTLDGLDNGTIQRPTIFAFSMCNRDDSISHWRQYADQGRGYSLGFRTRDLVKLKKSSLGLFRVRYNQQDQEEVYLSFYQEISKNSNGDLLFQDYSSTLKNAALSICVISALMKHKSYESEAEWRLITPITKNRNNEISYLGKRSMIKPYIIHRFSDLFNSDSDDFCAIENITLGPAIEGFAIDAIKMFLSTTDFGNVFVSHSKIPIREVA